MNLIRVTSIRASASEDSRFTLPNTSGYSPMVLLRVQLLKFLIWCLCTTTCFVYHGSIFELSFILPYRVLAEACFSYNIVAVLVDKVRVSWEPFVWGVWIILIQRLYNDQLGPQKFWGELETKRGCHAYAQVNSATEVRLAFRLRNKLLQKRWFYIQNSLFPWRRIRNFILMRRQIPRE